MLQKRVLEVCEIKWWIKFKPLSEIETVQITTFYLTNCEQGDDTPTA